jgi:hypothetical protein
MFVEPLVRLLDELSVKTSLTASRHQQDGPAFGVEGERDAPDPVGGIEAQLLHVRVLGAVQGIDAGASELRPEGLQELGVGEQFILNLLGEVREFPLEGRIEQNGPLHTYNMTLRSYVVKHIIRESPEAAP